MKDYYGENIGVYFSFLGVYTRALLFPALMGLICYLGDRIVEDEDGEGWFLIAYSIFVALWSTLLLNVWARKDRELRFLWGLDHDDHRGAEEKVRPMFRCSDQCVTKLNDHFIPELAYISKTHRALRLVASGLLFTLYIAAVVVSCMVCMWLRLSGGWWVLGGSVLNLLQMIIFEKLFQYSIEVQTLAEGHRTDRQFEQALAVKNWLFQFMNNFFILYYIAFAKNGRIFGVDSFCQTRHGEPTDDCLPEIQLQLAFIFCSKTVLEQLSQVVLPFILTKLSREWLETTRYFNWERDIALAQRRHICSAFCRTVFRCCRGAQSRSGSGGDGTYAPISASDEQDGEALSPNTMAIRAGRQLGQRSDIDFSIMGQVHTPTYRQGLIHGTFDDFNSLAIQFGFVTLFAPAFPLAALIALLNNITQIRTHAYKLCYVLQRPTSTLDVSSGISSWFTVFNLLSMVAVATNAALIAFVSPRVAAALDPDRVANGDEYHRFGIGMLWAIAVGAEHVLILFKAILHAMAPSEPAWVSPARQALDLVKQRMVRTDQQAKIADALRPHKVALQEEQRQRMQRVEQLQTVRKQLQEKDEQLGQTTETLRQQQLEYEEVKSQLSQRSNRQGRDDDIDASMRQRQEPSGLNLQLFQDGKRSPGEGGSESGGFDSPQISPILSGISGRIGEVGGEDEALLRGFSQAGPAQLSLDPLPDAQQHWREVPSARHDVGDDEDEDGILNPTDQAQVAQKQAQETFGLESSSVPQPPEEVQPRSQKEKAEYLIRQRMAEEEQLKLEAERAERERVAEQDAETDRRTQEQATNEQMLAEDNMRCSW